MAWLAATHTRASGQTFLAVDRNVAIRDYLVPIADALGKAVVPPDRPPRISRCRIGRIAEVLGYAPQHTFEQTLGELLDLARPPAPVD
jgi:nucleoside-diphosphate-sugar epimerase